MIKATARFPRVTYSKFPCKLTAINHMRNFEAEKEVALRVNLPGSTMLHGLGVGKAGNPIVSLKGAGQIIPCPRQNHERLDLKFSIAVMSSLMAVTTRRER